MEKDGMMILMVWEGEGYVSFKTRCADTSKKGKGSFSIRSVVFVYIYIIGCADGAA
jgi:hypothetical protein